MDESTDILGKIDELESFLIYNGIKIIGKIETAKMGEYYLGVDIRYYDIFYFNTDLVSGEQLIRIQERYRIEVLSAHNYNVRFGVRERLF